MNTASPESTETQPLLRAREVAARLAVTEGTVLRWAKTGVLRPIRIGGSTRFDPREVEALVEGASDA